MVVQVSGDPNATSVNFAEFLALMSMPAKGDDVDIDDEVLEAFKIVDADGDGFISQEDMLATLQNMGEPVSATEIMLMIEDVAADNTNKDKVNYDQFRAMIGYISSLE
mmetsp:Transcript_53918/g.123686  ORF Transcript_53918/g.123686 Transcript_53918/m.123686 type:complete len:108 (-) Transcript_53918:206-529(-)